MKELLEFIVKSIVSKPEAVEIEETKTDEGVDLKLSVDKDDMGIVIGKEGRIIRAIRSLVRIRAIREGVRVNIELLEPEGGKMDKSNQEEEEKTEPTEDAAEESTEETPEE